MTLGLLTYRFLVQLQLKSRTWYLQLFFTLVVFACVVVAYYHIGALRNSTWTFLIFVTIVSAIAVRSYSNPRNGIEQRLLSLGHKLQAYLRVARTEANALASRLTRSRNLILLARDSRVSLMNNYPQEMELLRRHLFEFAITFVPSNEDPARSGYVAAILREFWFRVYVTPYSELAENPTAYVLTSASPFPVFTLRANEAESVKMLLRDVTGAKNAGVTAVEDWNSNPNPLVQIVLGSREHPLDGASAAFIGAVLSCLAPLTTTDGYQNAYRSWNPYRPSKDGRQNFGKDAD